MTTTAGPLSTLGDSLASTVPCGDDAPLALALLDELSKGEPVTIGRLARAAEREEGDIAATLHRWPNVHRDGQARVVAFGGLGVTPTPHRFEVAGAGSTPGAPGTPSFSRPCSDKRRASSPPAR